MGKRVVIIASGETERRALPHLVRNLEGLNVLEVRIPAQHKQLTVDMAERLVKAAWYMHQADPPDKFVILIDTDGKEPQAVLSPYRSELPSRLANKIPVAFQFACACWHLEAWYFADEQGLRKYLGGALGSVNPSEPDKIQNPKLHLKHLLGSRVYTSVISEQIASTLDPAAIFDKSHSFKGFVAAVQNGSS